MSYVEFPKWKYHKTEPAVIVESAEEEAALGKGWSSTVFEDPKTYKEHMSEWKSEDEKAEESAAEVTESEHAKPVKHKKGHK